MATKGEKSEGMPTEKTKASCSGGVIASDCSACTDDFEMCVEQPQVDFNMEKLLSRVRSEEMFELRKLRHQHRPVSEFCSRQHLETFLSELSKRGKHSQPPQPGAASAAESPLENNVAERARQFASQPPAAVPQSLMPEAVRLEVRGLIEHRRVSEVLQGPLQQEMERVLGEGLDRRRRAARGRSQRRRARGNSGGIAGAGGLLGAVRNGSRLRGQSRRVRFVPPENGQYPMPRRDQTQIVEQLRSSPALNSLDAGARDRIVTEVTHLVQQQMVTSALSGEFRGVLELHVQQRADRINQGENRDNFHEVLERRNSSQYRPLDPDAPSASSFTELREEVHEIKGQLQELKQMMRVSFDLQLDIQRAIRQEVSAALAAFCTAPVTSAGAGGGTVPAAVAGARGWGGNLQHDFGSNARVVESGNCVICSEATIDSVVYRCGHMCVCMPCGLELKGQGLKCPICRAPITEIVRAYTSML